MNFQIQSFSLGDVERVVLDAQASNDLDKQMLQRISSSTRGGAFKVGTWVVDLDSGDYLIRAKPYPGARVWDQIYMLSTHGRLFELGVRLDLDDHVYFFRGKRIDELERAAIEGVALAALKAHRQYGLESPEGPNEYEELKFIDCPPDFRERGGI